MSLIIHAIRNAGDLSRERLVLKATKDIDIGQYAIFRAHADGDTVYSSVKRAYWFEDKIVKSGDFVILYSKEGENGEKLNKSGVRSYFFYWGSGEPCWSRGEDAAVLLRISSWTFELP